ncbi:MAG: NAD-dependent epimerase/dehydratase family protein [Candidatus Omnitrophica bacterium]|nr:NAD-dependent epimerase/dehydratase family protein [Candidatus Omnitrophota bacterium]
MNILIIGGSGHVSGAVARAALTGKHRVWAVTRGKKPLAKGVKSLIADRHDSVALETVVTGQAMVWDMVVDCICYNLTDIRQDIELFRRRAKQFVLVSTDFVYNPARRKFPQSEETEHWEGLLDYGREKHLCEAELMSGAMGEVAWTIVRPCHIYGPTSELGCLPLHLRNPGLIEKIQSGEPLKLVGGGYFLQQPILADDLAATIISFAGNRNAYRQTFNTAGPDILESRRYYEIIAGVLGAKLTIEEVPVSAYLAKHPEHAPFMCHRIYDLKRLRDSGLSVPSTSIAEGLRRHTEGLLFKN